VSELIRRGSGRAVARPSGSGAQRRDISGRSLQEDQWDGAVLDLADANLSVDTANLVASAVTDESGARRRSDGTYYRLRIGWVAYPQAVIVARLEQPLKRNTDGKLHTTGPYQLVSTQRYEANGPATRRSGSVPADAPADRADVGGGGGGGGGATVPEDDPTLHRRFSQGFQTLAFLPSTIRRGVIARIQQASVFTGQALRYDNGDRHEVSLLGLYPSGAVVLAASTHRDTTTWQTNQYLYTWVQNREQLPAADRRTQLPRS